MLDELVSVSGGRVGKAVVAGIEGVWVLVASLAEGERAVAVGVGRGRWGLKDEVTVEYAHGDWETEEAGVKGKYLVVTARAGPERSEEKGFCGGG